MCPCTRRVACGAPNGVAQHADGGMRLIFLWEYKIRTVILVGRKLQIETKKSGKIELVPLLKCVFP